MSERPLPAAPPRADDAPPDAAGPAAPAPPQPVRLESSSARLVGTLAVAGALAGLVIVLVFQWANPRIEAWRAAVLAEAVTEVLSGAERYETIFLEGAGYTPAPASDTSGLDRVYVGYDGDGRRVGVAVVGAEPGFQDVIRLIFGYDPATGEVIGMKVLESKETPGLGDKIEKDSTFLREFARVATPLVGAKASRATGADDEVTMITGATISSQAIVDIINHRLEPLADPIGRYWGSSVQAGADVPEEPARPPPRAARRGGGTP